MGRLDGRAAVVTGAGGGIGRGIARLLASEGAGVVVNDLGASVSGSGSDTRAAQLVVNEIETDGGQAVANYGSVADFAQAGELIQHCVDHFGHIDILVNVAGILRDRMIFNMTEAEWDAVIAVHLKGTFNTTRHASALMRQQRYGRIINFSSVSAWGSPGQPNYAAAKYGILGLTLTCANSLARYGVTTNAIVPGFVATRMTDSTPRAQQVLQETGKPLSEISRGTEFDPDNVAPIVVYLATEEAGYLNGQFIGIQGYSLHLYSHAEAVRILNADHRFSHEELFDLFPRSIGEGLTPPPLPASPTAPRPKSRTQLLQQDEAAWSEPQPGVKYWEWQDYFSTPRG
jgi:NAD(P)-dependent dehydrogenase (short-subunit alcohol dehydrogenase family)